jgi:hypothetical protein
MPVGIDPSEIYPYVISTDRSKPKEEQPTLLFYYPTCSEVRQIANKFDASNTAATVDESIKLRCDAMRIILCDWKNFKRRNGDPFPYDPTKLDEILTDTDFTELKARLIANMSASEIEKKRSVLFAPSKPDNSANDAPTASA